MRLCFYTYCFKHDENIFLCFHDTDERFIQEWGSTSILPLIGGWGIKWW